MKVKYIREQNYNPRTKLLIRLRNRAKRRYKIIYHSATVYYTVKKPYGEIDEKQIYYSLEEAKKVCDKLRNNWIGVEVLDRKSWLNKKVKFKNEIIDY